MSKKLLKEVKNYKELCEFFEVEPHSEGKAKKLQLEKLKTMGNFTKNKKGNGFKIYEKYDKPISPPKKISTKGLQKYVQALVINLLVNKKETKDSTISITKTKLLLEIGAVNENYTLLKNRDNSAELLGYDDDVFIDVLRGSNMIGNRTCAIIDRALDYLEKNSFITIEKVQWVKKAMGSGSDKEQLCCYKEATEEEIQFVLDCVATVKEEFAKKYKKRTDEISNQWLFCTNNFELYKKKLKKLLLERNICFMYEKLNIKISSQMSGVGLQSLTDRNTKSYKAQLNKEILESLLGSVDNYYNANHDLFKFPCRDENGNLKKTVVGKEKIVEDNMLPLRAQDRYLEQSKEIIDLMINRLAHKITEEELQTKEQKLKEDKKNA